MDIKLDNLICNRDQIEQQYSAKLAKIRRLDVSSSKEAREHLTALRASISNALLTLELCEILGGAVNGSIPTRAQYKAARSFLRRWRDSI